MPEKTLSRKIMDAQSQIIMLKESAGAIYESDAAEKISNVWFDGARITLGQVEDLMTCLFSDFGDSLDAIEKERTSGEPLHKEEDNPETEVSEEPDLSDAESISKLFEDPCEERECINVLLEKRNVNEFKEIGLFLLDLTRTIENYGVIIESAYEHIITQLGPQKKTSEAQPVSETPEASEENP